jgi:hypothetical protein
MKLIAKKLFALAHHASLSLMVMLYPLDFFFDEITFDIHRRLVAAMPS